MQCVVTTCRHESSTSSPRDIVFYKFPTEPSLLAAWLGALNKEDWKPEEDSVVCSDHFQDEDLLPSFSGQHKLRAGAVPVFNHPVSNDHLVQTSVIKVCRVCFVTDREMYLMRTNDSLYDAYQAVTGLSLANETKLPRSLCTECAARLLHCARFRSRSLQAHMLLLQLVNEHGRITVESIQSINEVHGPARSDTTNKQTDGRDFNVTIKKEDSGSSAEERNTRRAPDLGEDVAVNGIKVEMDEEANVVSVYIPSLPRSQEEPTAHRIKIEKDDDNTDDARSEGYVNEVFVDQKAGGSEIEGGDYASDDNLLFKEKTQERTLHQDISHATHVDTCRVPKAAVELLTKTKLICNLCPFKAFNKRRLLSHLKAHAATKSYTCGVCSFKTMFKGKLTCHYRVHSGVKPYSCDVCKKTFRQNSALRIHMTKHSGDRAAHTCDICNKVFEQNSILQRHLLSHSGEKPYTCDVCSAAFSLKSNLKVHIRIHSGEKPYTCNICNKSFVGCSTLRRHLRVHSGEKSCVCPICNKAFRDKTTLQRHLRVHSGEKPYSCDVCNRAYSRKADLEKHLRMHPDMIYSCYICLKKFGRAVTLEKHMKIHNDEKPFSCDTCNKKFKRKNSLQRHIKKRCGKTKSRCVQ